MVTDQLYKASETFPKIPSNIDRRSLNTIIKEYSIRNKLVVSVTRFDAKSLIFQCVKSGKQREAKRIENPSKCRTKMSQKTERPYTIKFFKPRGKNLLNHLDPKNEMSIEQLKDSCNSLYLAFLRCIDHSFIDNHI
ncbi:hypothetical protein A0J61_09660 [Choanephora cucurbitarum]|uniref:Uncharacterized protein n=1 Tax=Choanephora cucurbitarum TaxID=101091 RepID=A0A1C7MZX5_9FUNG|nr:hypothetical protein A0J61_09660 [Choanephora cucurbitarum]